MFTISDSFVYTQKVSDVVRSAGAVADRVGPYVWRELCVYSLDCFEALIWYSKSVCLPRGGGVAMASNDPTIKPLSEIKKQLGFAREEAYAG